VGREGADAMTFAYVGMAVVIAFLAWMMFGDKGDNYV
jgi:hypothetical protein